ncbi:hypothetical protein SAMN00777080_0137 [Aquiflexum balticum DSM 16537]|uniref:DUF3575 domain-containing protein n=1 Tax=Aquiflexum balticum DSM 16537 TaxID=758820 RepID=A0A1W2GYY8_9BACT|nr:DUF3575 domain-containing protein [Aquiflexum balticum]SMD41612.1 hypothetical protein SAMN00777080_0137 [Aquiflexum balticum DSM 16537]
MKKILFVIAILAVLSPIANAQSLEDPKGEIRLNFLNTILLGSVEIGYDFFVGHDQSVGVELHLNDRFGYSSSSGDRSFSATSVLVSYNFFFAGDDNGKIYISPYFKYRFGDFTDVVDNITEVTSLNSGYLGLIGGYRWNYNNFAFGPFAGIGRGFSEPVNDKFSAVEFKAGFNVGYRF